MKKIIGTEGEIDLISETTSNRLHWQFRPNNSIIDGKWNMQIIQSQQYSIQSMCIPMDEFLMVCRAFAADAKSYK